MGQHIYILSWKDALNTLSDIDEVCELGFGVALITIGPLLVNENNIVKCKSLLPHVQEPHGHGAGPHHQTNELIT